MELPRLEPIWKKYRNRGLSIVAVEATRSREAAQKFVGDNELTYHFLEDTEGDEVVQGIFGVQSFPSSYLIDSDGKILRFHVGFSEGDEVQFEEEIEEMLEG